MAFMAGIQISRGTEIKVIWESERRIEARIMVSVKSGASCWAPPRPRIKILARPSVCLRASVGLAKIFKVFKGREISDPADFISGNPQRTREKITRAAAIVAIAHFRNEK